MSKSWQVQFSKSASKQYESLMRCGQKPSIIDIIDTLVLELEASGPKQHTWPNFGKLSEIEYHCHLKKGRPPTYVACWKVICKNSKIIEVTYVGTHEKAPY